MTKNSPFISPDAPRLSDVLEQLGELDLTPTRRRDLRSSINSLCRLIDKAPEEVPANINWIHIRLRRISPAGARISKKRLQNIKADALKALELCGCSRSREDWLRAPSPAWQSLLDRIPDKHDLWKLSQLAQYCSACGIAPTEVTDEHLADLLEALEQETFVDKPIPKVAAAAAVWNRLAGQLERWPRQRLRAPRKREPWTFPIETFPESFQADVARWLERLGSADPFDEDSPTKPLRASTIAHRRFQIQEMASALVHAGIPRAEITSLAVLVELENLKKGLRYIMDRFEGKPTEAIHGLAMGLKAIARHHVRISEPDLDLLRKLCSRLNLEVDGLREKNRRRLEQLEDENNLARLLHLPAKLISEAGRPGIRPHKAALLVQAALAIEILLYAPMRIGNLSGLNLERHLRPVTVKRQRLTQISIPAEEVKNGKPLTYELGPGTSQLLDLYCRSARPVLLNEPSEYLFPAQDGGPKLTSALSTLIKKTIWEFTGLDINAHLFRSIAAKIHNRVHPGDFLTHSHVIGDSLRTAMRAYAQFEQKNALRHYQKSVDAARQNLRAD